jgi:acyl-CoA reductase-like NAD-dependent aldehyde dehydrogenase
MPEPIDVRNPRTGTVDTTVTPPSADDLDAVTNRLRAAQPDWGEGGVERRVDALQAWKEALAARESAIVEALAADTGRWDVSELELEIVLGAIDRWCEQGPGLLDPGDEAPSSVPFVYLRRQLVPRPLVGIISPWNFPLLLSTIDLIPALVAGAAAVVKPSEVTPRFVEPVQDAIDATPGLRDVVQYVQGAGDTGKSLVDRVDAVCFTGSVETGRRVGEAAAQNFIPAFLELGGQDPAVVLESADLDLATSSICWGSTVNTGQACQSLERVYVHETVVDPFVEQLVAKAEQVDLAYPEYEDGELGPIISAAQVDVLEDHLAGAKANGATVECGGTIERLGGGAWLRPTVFTEVDHSMKIMTEETFGPIMPVMPVASTAEAVERANDTKYGLGGAVFAGPEEEAVAVAEQIEAGAISVNDGSLTSVIQEGEKDAFKYSGLGGSRVGPASLQRFLRRKSLLVKKEDVPDPWWYDHLTGTPASVSD